jgi:hypothetical protein
MVRKVAWILAILVLANTGFLGLYNGVTEMTDGRTPLQQSVTIGTLLYGALGVAAVVALIARHASGLWLTVAWAIVVTYVASMAVIAYGGTDVTVGAAVGAGIGSAVLGIGMIWCARTTLRPASLHDRVHASSGTG